MLKKKCDHSDKRILLQFENLPQNQKTLNCNIALREKLQKRKLFSWSRRSLQ